MAATDLWPDWLKPYGTYTPIEGTPYLWRVEVLFPPESSTHPFPPKVSVRVFWPDGNSYGGLDIGTLAYHLGAPPTYTGITPEDGLKKFLANPQWVYAGGSIDWKRVIETAVVYWGGAYLLSAAGDWIAGTTPGAGEGAAGGLSTGETAAGLGGTTGAGAAAAGTAGAATTAATAGNVASAAANTSAAAANAGSAAANAGSTILSKLDDFVKSAEATVQGVLKPINDTIDGITKTVRSINDGLIQPILRPIQTIENTTSSLVAALKGDIKDGLKGLVKIPQQISDALTSVDASLSRSMQQLGYFNAETAKKIIAPAIFEAGRQPLTELTSTLSPGQGRDKLQAAHEVAVSLAEDTPVDEIANKVKQFEDFATNNDSWWGPLIQWMWSLLFVGDYVVKQVENAAIPWEHHVKMSNPYEALGAGEAIEAWRRDVLNESDARAELARNGLNTERQDVLFQIAQYLFTPTDAVRLLNRGLIDDKVFKQLMNQNNLDRQQYEALQGLIKFVYGPSDAAQLKIRGFIDEQVYLDLQKSNNMNEEDALSTLLLAIRPVNSSLRLAMQGRIAARDKGFLPTSFNTKPDQETTTAFERESKSDQEANLEQLAHYRIPPPEWFITAYFRKIRTRTDCYRAFEAANVPEELWDDMFTVNETYPSVFQLPSMLGAGALTREQATDVLEKLGFPADLIKPFIDFGLQGAKTTKATTAADLASLSLGNAKELFLDGVLTQDDYKQVLLDHGYSEDAAVLTVDVAVIAQQRQQRKDYAGFLVDEVKLGNVTIDDAVSKLYENSFTEQEVAGYQLKMRSAKQANSKQPSRADLAKMASKGLIQDDLWESMLEVLGYSKFWAGLIMEIDRK